MKEAGQKFKKACEEAAEAIRLFTIAVNKLDRSKTHKIKYKYHR